LADMTLKQRMCWATGCC